MRFTSVLLVSLALSSGALMAESAAGISWTAPAGWKAQAPPPMHAATYFIAPIAGDSTGAECIVNYFGPGQGGSYAGVGGPMAAASKAVPGYRLPGAIVESPGGSVFFKLTGPAKTIAAQQKSFDQLLASIQIQK